MKKGSIIKGLCIVSLFLMTIGSLAVFSEPGGTDDPVVTKSYIVDKVVPELKAYVDEKLGIAAGGGEVTSRPTSFIVVNVKSGQKIIGESGTELILRMGQGSVIASKKGGLADTTSGYDLANASPFPSNHLLIVPVADGRGFLATTDAILMIKGGYTVQ